MALYHPQVHALGASNVGNTAGDTGTRVNASFVLAAGNNLTLSQATGANNVHTLSLSGPTQSNQTVGFYASSNTTAQSSSSTFDARSLTFRGAGIASVGASAGEVVISVPAGGGGGDGVNIIAAGTQTAATTGTVVFSNSNNVTFGMSNSSVVTASASFNQTNQTVGFYGSSNTTAQSSSSTFDARSLTFRGAGIVSVGASAGEVVISATGGGGGGVAQAAGTQTATSGTVVFSNSNGITFGMSNSSVVTAENRHLSYWEPYQYLTGMNLNNASLMLQPVTVSGKMDATQCDLLFRFTNSASAGNSMAISVGLYGMDGSTATRLSTASRGVSYNSTLGGASSATAVNGTRFVSVPLDTWAVTPGEYLFAFWMRTTSALTSGTISVYGRTGNSFNGYVHQTNSTSGTFGYFLPGIYSATTNAMPASVQVSEIQACGNSVQRQPWFAMYGTR